MSRTIATIAASIAITATPVLATSTLNPESSSKSVAAGVPKQFQGHWRLALKECPPAITDRPVWINEGSIRMDHSVGEIRVIELVGRHDVKVAGELRTEGDPRNATIRLELSESESDLTISEDNWSVKLQRCPEEKAI